MNNKRLLEAITNVDDKYIEEAKPMSNTNNVKKFPAKKFTAIAAAVAILAVSAVAIPQILNNKVAPIEQVAPPMSSPMGMRKYMHYNGSRYKFLNEGATFELSEKQLGNNLGTIEHDILQEPEMNSSKDFSATFGVGGEVYEISEYNQEFRVALKLDGEYYIAEKVDAVDGKGVDITEYFTNADFANITEKILINDHFGSNTLNTLSKKETKTLIENIVTATPAELTNEQYEGIGKAQTEGESYLLSFLLADGTQYEMYVIPSLSLAMVGDNKYTLASEFTANCGANFEGLTQQPMPMQ